MGNSTTALIKTLEQASSADALVSAVRALAAQQDPTAIPTLIKVLGYNNPGAAVAAVDGLVALGGVVVPQLLELLDGYNYGARAWAVRVFALIGDPRALDLLVETVTTDFSQSVRRAAARGLGNIDWNSLPPDQVKPAQHKALTALDRATEDGEWVVRYAAVVGLQQLGQVLDYQELPGLLSLLDRMLTTESEPGVRARIYRAQQQLHHG